MFLTVLQLYCPLRVGMAENRRLWALSHDALAMLSEFEGRYVDTSSKGHDVFRHVLIFVCALAWAHNSYYTETGRTGIVPWWMSSMGFASIVAAQRRLTARGRKRSFEWVLLITGLMAFVRHIGQPGEPLSPSCDRECAVFGAFLDAAPLLVLHCSLGAVSASWYLRCFLFVIPVIGHTVAPRWAIGVAETLVVGAGACACPPHRPRARSDGPMRRRGQIAAWACDAALFRRSPAGEARLSERARGFVCAGSKTR